MLLRYGIERPGNTEQSGHSGCGELEEQDPESSPEFESAGVTVQGFTTPAHDWRLFVPETAPVPEPNAEIILFTAFVMPP